jgi:PAS domain S-box-containing protein
MQEYDNEVRGEKDPAVKTTFVDDKYKTLFEQVNAAAFLAAYEGQILEANQKSCELFGYRWDELLRLSLKDILTKETDWDQLKDEIAGRGGLNLETESICKNGNYLPVEMSVSLFTMNNKPVIFVLIWDVTERKKAEKRLKESEKKYHGLFEYTTDGIFVLDARGDILDANTKMCEMLDLSKDVIIGKNLFSMDFLTATSLPIVVNQFEQLLSEKTAKSYTTQIKNKQQNVLDVEVSSFFLIKKDNEVDNFVLIVRDITERNLTKQQRRKEHGLLKTLMNNIPDSVYFKDDQNRFVLVNKAKADHAHVTPEDMIGKTDFEFKPEEQAQKILDDDNAVMKSGHPIINKIEKEIVSDDIVRWVSVTKIPRYNAEGDIIGTMGISRDVTTLEKAKEDLAKSEEQYRAVFENSSFAIILTDNEGRIISWNKLVEDLLQISHDDVYLKSVESLYPPEEWEKIRLEYHHEKGIKHRLETKILKKDRGLIDVDLSINVLRSTEGEIIGATEIISDITKRKETEKELEQKHELLTTLMENIPDSVYFKDQQNRFILVNKAKADHAHVTPEEMIGKTDFEFKPENQAKAIADDDDMIMNTGKSIVNKIEEFTDASGTTKWMSVTKIPRYNKHNKIIGTMGISRDITWLKQIEKESAERLELLQTLMDTIPDSVYFKDGKNKFILVNKAKAHHWKVEPDEMIGKTDFEFLPHDEAQKAFNDDKHILEKGEPIVDKMEQITGSDGKERLFSVTKVPRRNAEGKIIGTIGISRDVTKWKKGKLKETKKK